MDTSLSKALIMVAGVLLAMIVIAFVARSFMRVGNWAKTQDDEVLIEQREKFNKEYEVYDKDLMYGVDVISCLNKALTNNEQTQDNRLINGNLQDTTYEVKVKVILTKKDNYGNVKPLEESLIVTYRNGKGQELDYTQNNGPAGIKLRNMNRKFNFLEKKYKEISKFNENSDLKTKTEVCDKLKNVTEFNITAAGNETNEEVTRELISLADTIAEIIKNTDATTKNKGEGEGWSRAEFRSALYDLKTRKFKCTSLTYSNLGRVNYIEFQEY